MKNTQKQQFQNVIADIAEFGTGVIEVADKQPPWIVRNIKGFIYAVENMSEHIVCTVLIPTTVLPNREIKNLEEALCELNRRSNYKYIYSLREIQELPLICISAYYPRTEFDSQKDILALEHHALYILNEI